MMLSTGMPAMPMKTSALCAMTGTMRSFGIASHITCGMWCFAADMRSSIPECRMFGVRMLRGNIDDKTTR